MRDREKNGRWIGGVRTARESGYRYVRVWEGGKGFYRAEHRFIMEGIVGRPLRTDESVHHRNGVRDDNRPENLELLSRSAHGRLHMPRARAQAMKLKINRFSPTDIQEMRLRCSCGESQASVARLFKTTRGHVCQIVSGARWASVQ